MVKEGREGGRGECGWNAAVTRSSASYLPRGRVLFTGVEHGQPVTTSIATEIHCFRAGCFPNSSSRMLWEEAVSHSEGKWIWSAQGGGGRSQWAERSGKEWSGRARNETQGPCSHLCHTVAFRWALVSSLGKFGDWTAWFLKFLPYLNYFGSMWSPSKQKVVYLLIHIFL